MFLSIILIIVPLAIYLIAVIALDSHTLFRWRTLFKSLIGGIAAGLVALVLLWELQPLMSKEVSNWVDPVVEEILNILALVPLLKRKRIAMFSDALIYGAAVGSGFALVENLVYLQFGGIESELLLFRSLSTSLLHMGNVAISALIFVHFFKRRSQRGRIVWTSLIPFLIPVIIHLAYNNIALLIPNLKFVVLLVLFTTIFLIASVRNDHLMQQWLDEGISDHILLLSKMRQGEFYDTPQGAWLQEQRGSYNDAQFADVNRYLEITLELSIHAKSRQILQEAGFKTPKEENFKVAEMIQEYETLAQRLGPAVVRTLRPIVYLHHSDHWVLRQRGG